DLHCVEIIAQPEILWIDDKGRKRRYHADCWTAFLDFSSLKWKIFIFEVKTKQDLQNLQKNSEWKEKNSSIKKYCEEREWEFRIITEEYIDNIRLSNIKFFRHVVRIPPEKPFIKIVKEILNKFYKKKMEYTFIELLNHVHKVLEKQTEKISQERVRYSLFYLLFYQELYFDWENLFSPSYTLIYQNFDHKNLFEPVYQMKPVEHTFPDLELPRILSEFDLDLLSKRKVKEGKNRFWAIKALLEIEQTRRVTENDVIRRAEEVGKSSTSLYRWLRIYKETRDWKSLLAKDYQKGNRQSRLSEAVERIIQKSITTRSRMGSISACWREVKTEIIALNGREHKNYEIPSRKTISNRIKKLPAKERYGKQGGYIHDEIARSVYGELSASIKQPLDFIQMDHTKLDIFLVDQFDLKVRKRPWLTLGVDGRTRMIYTWLLSYDSPNSVTVAKAMVRGMIPKDNEMKQFEIDLPYPIFGVPCTIQYDNAKEFDSNHVKEFCLLHGVEDAQFRPSRRPDTGAFVERIFRTINEKIRDAGLPGYSPPIKQRPEGIKPKKEAKMTFPEFEKWLVNEFVIYHHTPHNGLEKETGIKRSPIEQYRLDLNGRKPPLPANLELLRFEIFPSEKRVLNANGITWKKNNYNNRALTDIRRRDRGKKREVLFRYDPQEITSIWVYDELKQIYIRVGVSSGLLSRFVQNNPDISIRLSEYEAVRKKLREISKKETPLGIAALLMENKRIANEARNKRRQRKVVKTQKKSM
ncbi:MAG: Mu transposase C-terminal domain-containing protein, partial [Candidatus Hodarchaeales archaeon]